MTTETESLERVGMKDSFMSYCIKGMEEKSGSVFMGCLIKDTSSLTSNQTWRTKIEFVQSGVQNRYYVKETILKTIQIEKFNFELQKFICLYIIYSNI